MPTQDLRFVVGEEENPARVDKYLSSILPDISRNFLQKLIESGSVLVNGKKVKSHRQVKVGDVLDLHVPEPVALDVEPEDIPLETLYEDANLLVINKSPGIVVHPAPGHLRGTIVNALLFHAKDLSSINGVLRPGIVHRLDKDTSGCLLIAKNDQAHRSLAAQFENRTVKKEYLALVNGQMVQRSGVIDMRIGRHLVERKKMSVRPSGGREAKTFYECLEEINGCTLLSLKPTTGRTHQLRVHLAAMGFPILGDLQYGSRRRQRIIPVPIPRQMLHAHALVFCHPSTGKIMECIAPLPADMQEVLSALRGMA